MMTVPIDAELAVSMLPDRDFISVIFSKDSPPFYTAKENAVGFITGGQITVALSSDYYDVNHPLHVKHNRSVSFWCEMDRKKLDDWIAVRAPRPTGRPM